MDPDDDDPVPLPTGPVIVPGTRPGSPPAGPAGPSQPQPLGRPIGRPAPRLTACDARRLEADQQLVAAADTWWQNWPKTHAYVAQKTFYPRSVDELAIAIQRAEADARPLRATGGG